jgi:hypothetical protein
MAVPDWRTLRAGTRVRAAVWLQSEVGVNGTFTKAELRQAFPGVEQVDRRMRDLRTEGWVIATSRDDPSLEADELRLVAEGGPVWEKGYRSRQAGRPTDQQRQATLAADNYACVYCGVAAGEPYPDDELRTAKLSAARVESDTPDGRSLVTLCDRCRAGAGELRADDGVLNEILALPAEQLRMLQTWIERGDRRWAPEERLWARYRHLPASLRERVRDALTAS